MAGLPWVKVDADLPTHPKTLHLAELLGDDAAAIAALVCLWLWASQNAPTGCIHGAAAERIIERGAGWAGEKGKLVAALIESRWVDKVRDGLRIHDWADHQGAHIDKAANDRLRKRNGKASFHGNGAEAPVQPTGGSQPPRGKIEREIESKETHIPGEPGKGETLELVATEPTKPVTPLVAFLRKTYPDVKDPWKLEANSSSAFPAVDLLAEARAALAWEQAESRNKRVRHGSFLTTWWGNAQRRAGRSGPSPPGPDRPKHVQPAQPSSPASFAGRGGTYGAQDFIRSAAGSGGSSQGGGAGAPAGEGPALPRAAGGADGAAQGAALAGSGGGGGKAPGE